MPAASAVITLPPNYSALSWSIPSLTEATTFLGAAVLKSVAAKKSLDMVEIEGNSGFVVGIVEIRSSAVGLGGQTDNDKDEITITCVDGTHASKSWPTLGQKVTISGSGVGAPFNGDWKMTGGDVTGERKKDGGRSFTLKRWADVTLV